MRNNSNTYLHVQVVFRQGVVKSFLAPKEILMDDFMKVVRLHGKVKRLRYQPDCGGEQALALVAQGAMIVDARRNHVEA